MGSQYFREKLEEKVDFCIKQAISARSIEHHGMAGEIREILIKDVLKDLLPDGFKIGTGKISDSNGNLSNQCDIVIYNKSKFPPILIEESKGVFPIESVAYVIEVKTTLNANEIKTTIDKADKLKMLNGRKPHFVLFAFKSDVKDTNSDISRIKEYVPDPNAALNIFCIVNRLYAYSDTTKWNFFSYTKGRYEVISLIIGILNTLMTWEPAYNSIVPGHYFGIEENAFM